MHFVGIEAQGCPGIARIMLARGIPDMAATASKIAALNALRATTSGWSSAAPPSDFGDAETVVVSTTVHEDNAEYPGAPTWRRGLRVLRCRHWPR